ncbi:hypothetical protein IJJ08_03865 [bacterium]|nr:hypothetical protein [bacterium]
MALAVVMTVPLTVAPEKLGVAPEVEILSRKSRTCPVGKLAGDKLKVVLADIVALKRLPDLMLTVAVLLATSTVLKLVSNACGVIYDFAIIAPLIVVLTLLSSANGLTKSLK